ncbi:uncharacterized protein BDR25DRAFT_349723 [Lindgomyces ingoldianus]|uniref:Uncharacterized protein n=1 Tax=Lindgomyces ingoldianus TaxID=673940 RepID=A0ACB6RE87_9PLEO|nr:uncharacterized protein BDR25DRAFT_349723 [Lindgomyces ingoldianus]KAF2476647.1 hypothetical protein BDR25DRAFT_349723 [Lindgomyces ingoldianus]
MVVRKVEEVRRVAEVYRIWVRRVIVHHISWRILGVGSQIFLLENYMSSRIAAHEDKHGTDNRTPDFLHAKIDEKRLGYSRNINQDRYLREANVSQEHVTVCASKSTVLHAPINTSFESLLAHAVVAGVHCSNALFCVSNLVTRDTLAFVVRLCNFHCQKYMAALTAIFLVNVHDFPSYEAPDMATRNSAGLLGAANNSATSTPSPDSPQDGTNLADANTSPLKRQPSRAANSHSANWTSSSNSRQALNDLVNAAFEEELPARFRASMVSGHELSFVRTRARWIEPLKRLLETETAPLAKSRTSNGPYYGLYKENRNGHVFSTNLPSSPQNRPIVQYYTLLEALANHVDPDLEAQAPANVAEFLAHDAMFVNFGEREPESPSPVIAEYN